jgi:hypothetical protein
LASFGVLWFFRRCFANFVDFLSKSGIFGFILPFSLLLALFGPFWLLFGNFDYQLLEKLQYYGKPLQ